MRDLPQTSKEQALASQEAALSAGLKNVRLGNVYLVKLIRLGPQLDSLSHVVSIIEKNDKIRTTKY